MIALLHTADWQIGQVFSQFASGDAAALLEARFKVVEPLRQVSGGPCKTRKDPKFRTPGSQWARAIFASALARAPVIDLSEIPE